MSSEFGEAAAELGARDRDVGDLVRWALQLDRSPPTGRDPLTARTAALGPDLYGGSSGVALFLAEAGAQARRRPPPSNRARGDPACARPRRRDRTRTHRDGLYSAPSESCTRRNASPSCSPLRTVEPARELLAAWRRNGTRTASADVMSGSAGAVAGLVALNDRLDERVAGRSGGLAGRGGDRQGRARAGGVVLGGSPAGARCTTPAASPTAPPASGTLSPSSSPSPATLGSERRPCSAFEYERSWFDARSRTLGGPPRRRPARAAAMLRCRPPTRGATALPGSPCHACARQSCSGRRLSTATRRRRLRRASGTSPSFSLMPLTTSRSVTAPRVPATCCSTRRTVAGIGLRASQPRWAGGASSSTTGPARGVSRAERPRGETPALLLGFAGIGMFYLRLLDPGVATPLLVHCPGEG